MSNLSTKQGKISRGAYIAEAALEYFISIMITGAYLTNLLNDIGFSTAAQTVISSLVTMTFSAELFSVLLIHKTSSVKRWVTAWNFFNQMLFALMYFTPFFNIPTGIKSAIFLFLLIAGSMIEHSLCPFKTTWHMSNVENGHRGVFTAKKEIVSLIGGVVFSFIMGQIIDAYEAAGNMNGSFVAGGITIIGLATLHFISMCLIKDNHIEAEYEHKPFLEGLKDSLKVTILDKSYRHIIVVFVLYYIANASTYSFGAFQRNTLGFSMTFIAVLTFLYSVVRSFFSVPFGKYADKHSWEKMLRICVIIASIGFFINTFSTPETGKITYTIYYMIFAISMAGINSGILNLTFDYVKEENRSVAIGWKSAIGGVAGFLTSCIESVFIQKIESNGNQILGITVYPQQILSLISSVILIILALYLYKVVRNQKIVIEK
ncbi:MAG: MFS transporter [Clostridia bacterium]|nr:MFS transporter [Clostridia bacterium]